jgi:hypothetical protein
MTDSAHLHATKSLGTVLALCGAHLLSSGSVDSVAKVAAADARR